MSKEELANKLILALDRLKKYTDENEDLRNIIEDTIQILESDEN